jgi:hypothetical protein
MRGKPVSWARGGYAMAKSEDLDYLLAKLDIAMDSAVREFELIKSTLERRLAPDGVIDGRMDSLEIELILMKRLIKRVIGE